MAGTENDEIGVEFVRRIGDCAADAHVLQRQNNGLRGRVERGSFKPSDYLSHAISSAVTRGQSASPRACETDDHAANALPSVRIDTLVLSGTDDAVVAKENAAALTRNAHMRGKGVSGNDLKPWQNRPA